MAAGYPSARADIDARAGTLVVTLRNTFDEVARFKAFLDATPDADLEAAPRNYTATEVAQLKSAFSDLAVLGAVFRGEASSDVYDYRTFAKLLVGVL